MERDSSITRKVQLIEVDILNEFKRVCEKHNLRYFAIGGTCIGAIRHAGFIPWDDDVDVAMPLADYENFRAIAKDELAAPFELYDPHDHLYCNLNFLKIHNTKTAFIETCVASYPDRHTGVYLDVFPLYGLPKGNWKVRYLLEWHELMLRKNMYVHLLPSIHESIMSKFIFLTACFRRKAGGCNYYLKKMEERFSQYSFEDADKILFGWMGIGSLYWHKANYNRSVFSREIFDGFKEVPFESTTIRIPIGYDEYLTQFYGDYMQLPPEEERAIHSAAVIDLEKSFREYAKELGKQC